MPTRTTRSAASTDRSKNGDERERSSRQRPSAPSCSRPRRAASTRPIAIFPDPTPIRCTEGVTECRGDTLIHCVNHEVVTVDDCSARGMACARRCSRTPCRPTPHRCDAQTSYAGDAQGQTRSKLKTCDSATGEACRRDACVSLCLEAAVGKSNIGCEYWGVDPTTPSPRAATPPPSSSRSSSRIRPDRRGRDCDDRRRTLSRGQPSKTRIVGTASVGSSHLEVFKLGPKEVDGSPPGLFDQGTGTALTRNAFAFTDGAIVAYQFNPLDNVSVFSNDASLLLPVSALGTRRATRGPMSSRAGRRPSPRARTRRRAGWQSAGVSHDRGHAARHEGPPQDDRARDPAAQFPAGLAKNRGSMSLQPSTSSTSRVASSADFTGSLIDSSAPGRLRREQAGDAPFFTSISKERCADHLEDQLTPIRAVGRSYVIGRVPNPRALSPPPGPIVAPFDEGEISCRLHREGNAPDQDIPLPPPWDAFSLDRRAPT